MVHILYSCPDGGSTVGIATALGNFELVNLLESSTVIGTARVKSIQVVNNEVRLYLMDIQLKGRGGSNDQITDITSVERHGDFDTAPHNLQLKLLVVLHFYQVLHCLEI